MSDNNNATQEAAEAGANTPWGWLGLLKWSLAYSDGTNPTSAALMSEEDKAFLERVMKEGIIDENQRMKEILQNLTDGLDDIRNNNTSETDELEDLLQELRDIVEQIDYARAFAAMKGLDFLIGCVAQEEIPRSIRGNCLGIVATMAANNPPLQTQLLEMGAIKTLSDVFHNNNNNNDVAFRAKIIQALGAAVRSHDLSEQVFCGVEQAPQIIYDGLQQQNNSNSDVLQRRTLFFLRALITSDDSTRQRVRLFAPSIGYVADHLTQHDSAEIREMALALLVQLLEQQKSVNCILERKEALAARGVERVAKLRAEERDYASVELEQWENLLVQLARAVPDPEEPAPLMIMGPPSADVQPQ